MFKFKNKQEEASSALSAKKEELELLENSLKTHNQNLAEINKT